MIVEIKMCKEIVTAAVLFLAFCCYAHTEQTTEKRDEDVSMSNYMKRLDLEKMYPRFPDFSYPAGQFPGMPVGDYAANYVPPVSAQYLKRLHSMANQKNSESVKKVVAKVTDAIYEANVGNYTGTI